MNARLSIGLAVWATVLLQPSAGIAGLECGFSPPHTATAEAKQQYKTCEADLINKRMGKYFCYIKNMAGIQYPMEGEGKFERPNMKAAPFVGKIRPHDEKFFMEISRNPTFETCKEGSPMRKYCDLETAYPEFLFKAKSSDVLVFGDSSDSYTFHNISGAFILYGTSDFRSFSSAGSSYLAEGKCEKID